MYNYLLYFLFASAQKTTDL